MRLTKKITLLTIVFLYSSLSFANNSNKGTTIEMDTKMFIEKVTDYKTNPNTWNYVGDKPCIIDFYTTWCGPCKRLAPVMEELAKQFNGEIYIYKVDTEKHPELARLFDISSIPTLLFCPLEGAPQMNKGVLPKDVLIEAINTVLLKK